MLRARMGIRAHPTLTNGKTSKGHLGTQSCGCAGQTVRPSPHSISQTSVGKLFNRSMFDLSICQDYLGQVKPLPRSHPRPRLRRKGGVGRNGETARAVAVNDGAQAPPQGLSLTATSTTLAS